MKQSQIYEMKMKMKIAIDEAIDDNLSEVGLQMTNADVIGILEIIKMERFIIAAGDNLLDHTTYAL